VTQAQDTFQAAAELGLSRMEKNVLNLVVRGIKEDIDASVTVPAGSNEQIQFNNNGEFGATAELTWDPNVGSLVSTNLTAEEVLYTNSVQGTDIDGFSLNGAFTNTNGETAGSIEINGGQFSNPNAGVTGAGGNVLITGGSGPGLNSVVDGGNVYIEGGTAQNGGAHGSVFIEDIELLQIETTTAATAPRFTISPTTETSSVTLDISCVDGASLANFVIEGNGTAFWVIDSSGRVFPRPGTTTMSTGHLYIPAAAGAPTGTPLAINGSVPLYFDTSVNDLYVFTGGSWVKFSPAPA